MAASDPRIAAAREHHNAAGRASKEAARRRVLRDELVRELRREDPGRWTYAALAVEVGCTPELIAKIVRPQVRR